ncbi:hypothetical protein BDA96_02G008200 [Sorghum bicolor]|uniref:SGNH hydrolase-type esterase domain-containing protein n=1 Tax=Sorghum bicolor TaxID=4558 RepID=A0A921US68_SORBI|nr:hypothetical protein BDA96_02G008200 [Sorghum bicolor]
MMIKLLTSACILLLFLNVAESSRALAAGGGGNVTSTKRHHDHDHDHGGDRASHKHMLFVFGDEFADAGNLATEASLGGYSRTWRYPFGESDAAHGRKPTGRFSDGLVQSDYMAKIMGKRESPPAYNGDGWDGEVVDPSGLNFAVGGAGVMRAPPGAAPAGARVAMLRAQVTQLRDLVSDGLLDDKDFDESVALVAFSGNDYAQVGDADGFEALIPMVVDEVASLVSELLDMGVTKVVVNTLPPFGCTPWLARGSNYTACNGGANDGPAKHNAMLRDRLDGDDDVMVLDVYTVMMDMVAPPAEGSELSARFKERLQPCCESYGGGEDGAYCGDPDGRYWLCDHPEDYFYWDFVNPTQAGWRAVMQMLQGPIMAFLGISQLNHF